MTTPYETMGGEETFARLVDRFYAGVAGDPILRPLYPDDLVEPARRLKLFLMQYFGGPQRYSSERGHPRLRARHLPFKVDQAARDAWLAHMVAAVMSLSLSQPDRDTLLRYFSDAATFLINSGEA